MARSSPQARGPGRALALLAVVVLGGVAVASTLIVRRTVVDDRTYTSALVAADAYERLYTEVLADPQLAALQEDLLGRVVINPALAVQARALVTSSLRWAVPPSVVRSGAETVISGTLAHLRGESDDLALEVDVSGTAGRVAEAVRTTAASLLAGVDREALATTVEQFRAEAAAFVDEAIAGIVPTSLPSIDSEATDHVAIVDAVLGRLGPRVDDELREQVRLYVAAGEVGDALVAVAAELLAQHARAALDRVDATALRARTVELVGTIDAHARAGAGSVEASLGSARATVAWFGPATAVVGALAAVAASGTLLWSHRRDPRRAVLLLATGLVLTGVAILVLWWAVGARIDEPLERATGTGAGTWDLSPGLRGVLVDVRSEIGDTLTRAVAGWAAVPALAGLALAASVGVVTAAAGTHHRPARPRWFAAGGAVAGLVAAVAVTVGPASATDGERACNGHPELCDRPYDDVVSAATHNAMSSPDIVQVWPEHDGDLRAQLDAGVRALLIDTHYWTPVASPDQLQALDPLLPRPVAELVHRASAPLLQSRPGTFLCHNHCAFGGIELVDALAMVRAFLQENPDEVVTLIIQDAITTEDTAAAMGEARLTEHLHDHGADDSWPTLGELIDRGERLVVFAEEAGPPPGWYANAFEAMQETPFLALTPEQLSCRPNRGRPEAPLFLLNHWVQRVAPDRVDAANLNRLDVIVERARACADERGLLPNYIAVNFYNVGDVVEAVDVLNGVG